MNTDAGIVLWVDLCVDVNNARPPTSPHEAGIVHVIREKQWERIRDAVARHKPRVVCLDYDFPDRNSLGIARELRSAYPKIPLMMFTVQHCESLAVWAFRTGVRNFLVKPVPDNELVEGLFRVVEAAKPRPDDRRASRRNVLPPPGYRANFATARRLLARRGPCWPCVTSRPTITRESPKAQWPNSVV